MNSAQITLWQCLTNNVGAQREIRWDEFFAKLSIPVPFDGADVHPGWSPATFEPCVRNCEHVKGVCALVLDYDGDEPIDDAKTRWRGVYGLLHTTRKHVPESPRFRVILPLSRVVTREEYATLWARAYENAGRKIDKATKDAARFWYLPGAIKIEHFHAEILDGRPLDVDKSLASPAISSVAVRVGSVLASDYCAPVAYTQSPADLTLKRAEKYVERMPPAIQGSNGSGALWDVALALVQGFRLSKQQCLSLIWYQYNQRCKPPWSKTEILHKVEDAFDKSKVPSGYILDRDRDLGLGIGIARERVSEPVGGATGDPAEDWDRGGTEGPYAPEESGPPAERATKVYGTRTLSDILSKVYTRAASEKRERGVMTGFGDLDRALGGFRRGLVAVLGAETSWGKSSFAVAVADLALRRGQRVLIVSGEDTEDVYGQRFMSRRSGVSAMALRDGEVQQESLAQMVHVVANAEKSHVFLNGIGRNVEWLAEAIGRVAAEEEVQLVIVDYLQAFSCARKTQDRRNEVTHVARTFTDAIKNAGTAGLMFSQIRRTDGARPTMHDLKESGDVENMAEHVLIGYLSKPVMGSEESVRMISVEKNKDGPRGGRPIELPWDVDTASFLNIQ